MVPCEMNRVKLAPRRAQTAADALFRIHDGHTLAEAAARLRLDHLLGEDKAVVAHGAQLLRVVLGYTVTIHAHIEDDGEIIGNAVVAGKKPMPCPGGIVRRENKQTREAFTDYHWPNREKYNWK